MARRAIKKYLLTVMLSLFLLVLMIKASHAVPYIIIHKIAPIVEEAGMKYQTNDKAFEIVDGVNKCVVYGNIIETERVRERKFAKWLRVKVDDKTLGFIEKKMVAKFPAKYKKMKPEKFWISKDNTQLYIIPGKKALSRKHGGIYLPHGMTVLGVGTIKKGRGSWTLLKFERNGFGGTAVGIGERYGWVKTSRIKRI